MSANLPEQVRKVCVLPGSLVRDALRVLEESHREIVLVVDASGHLLGTITDGDIRRATLQGGGLEAQVEQVMHLQPITGGPHMGRREWLNLMNWKRVLQLPILDEQGVVVDLVLLSEMMQGHHLGGKAVVMAGGSGSRLRPLTYDIPKPLLPVASKPILEIVVEQLLEAGVETVYITTCYMAEMIERHFATLSYPGADIRFVREQEPMGTGGSLRLLRAELDQPFLVMNADVLTRLDYPDLLAVHRDQQAGMTIAVKRQEIQIPYGVVEADTEGRIQSFAEKPVLPFCCNIGIYAVNPEVLSYIPQTGYLDMNELIAALLRHQVKLCQYLVDGYWIDIGRLSDYQRACEDVLANRF